MPRRPTLIALAVALVAAALVGAAPALAITGGSPDTVHTNVGLVRFTTTAGRFRCSGTLISQTVVLTAGHCTEGPATNVYVSFDDALQPDPLQPGISPAERAAREAHYITGTAHPDPGWDGKLSLAKQHDQGVVVLSAPAATKWPAITPAPLPPVGFLDRNQGQLKNETFTLVGYPDGSGAGASAPLAIPVKFSHRTRSWDGVGHRPASAGCRCSPWGRVHPQHVRRRPPVFRGHLPRACCSCVSSSAVAGQVAMPLVSDASAV